MKRILTAEAANYMEQGAPPTEKISLREASIDRPLPYELIRFGQLVFAKIRVPGTEIFVPTQIVFKHKGKIKCAYIPEFLNYSIFPRTREMKLELLLAGAEIVSLDEFENMEFPLPF